LFYCRCLHFSTLRYIVEYKYKSHIHSTNNLFSIIFPYSFRMGQIAGTTVLLLCQHDSFMVYHKNNIMVLWLTGLSYQGLIKIIIAYSNASQRLPALPYEFAHSFNKIFRITTSYYCVFHYVNSYYDLVMAWRYFCPSKAIPPATIHPCWRRFTTICVNRRILSSIITLRNIITPLSLIFCWPASSL
jgi:hypothetical protein